MSLFFCCVVLHCVNISHFSYLFFWWGAFTLFQGSGYDKEYCYEHSWAMSLWYDLESFGCIPKSGIAESWGMLFPNFLRNPHIDIQSSCTSFHFHQQWRNVPFTPYSLQYKLSLVFLTLAILIGVRWNLSWFDFHIFNG